MANEQTFPGSGYNIQLSDLLARQIFGQRTLSSATHNRIPFIFTSDLNLYNAGYSDPASVAGSGQIGGAEQVIPDQTPNIRDSISVWPGFNNTSQDQGRPAATPQDDGAMIAMAVNPQSIKWDQPKRFTKKDTQTGALFLFFSDNAGENNDILTLTISGTSGNIDTRGLANSDDTVNSHARQNSQKLLIWHRLYNLSRQPVYYKDNTGTTYQNNFYIIYRTMLIPFELRFIGFFSKVLEFTEDATDPFKRNFTMTFTVTSTDPPLTDLIRFATSSIPPPLQPNTPGAVTQNIDGYPPNPSPFQESEIPPLPENVG